MAWLVPGMVTTAVRVTALLALVTALPAFVMVSLAPALALTLALLLLPLVLLALVLAGTRARRLEQLKRREPAEASDLVRGWQQLPRLQGAAVTVGA